MSNTSLNTRHWLESLVWRLVASVVIWLVLAGLTVLSAVGGGSAGWLYATVYAVPFLAAWSFWPLPLRARVVTLGTLAVLGGLAWHFKVAAPMRAQSERQKWTLSGIDACKGQLAALPGKLEVEGFTDESANLRESALLELLGTRQVGFIEIRVPKRPDGSAVIARPDGQGDPGWVLSSPAGAYARVELAGPGDPGCSPVSSYVQFRLREPPFMPGSCLRVTYLDQARAGHQLLLRPPADPAAARYGQWVFADRVAGQDLAVLATVDTAASVSSSKIAPLERKRIADCGNPYTTIVDRIVGSKPPPASGMAAVTAAPSAAGVQAGQSVEARSVPLQRVPPAVDPETMASGFSDAPRLTAEEDVLALDKPEMWRLFSPQIPSTGAWEAAVTQAQVSGRAAYGSSVLLGPDLRRVELVAPKVWNETTWRSFGLDDGFLVVVVKGYSWRNQTDNFIARYALDGGLRWVVRVVPPSTRACFKFSPDAVYLRDDRLVVADRCLTQQEEREGKSPRVITWSFPVKSLPGPL